MEILSGIFYFLERYMELFLISLALFPESVSLYFYQPIGISVLETTSNLFRNISETILRFISDLQCSAFLLIFRNKNLTKQNFGA